MKTIVEILIKANLVRTLISIGLAAFTSVFLLFVGIKLPTPALPFVFIGFLCFFWLLFHFAVWINGNWKNRERLVLIPDNKNYPIAVKYSHAKKNNIEFKEMKRWARKYFLDQTP